MAQLSRTRPNSQRTGQSNTQKRYEISRADLPLHCPLPDSSLWNSHPQVYLPIETTGRARCPYCSAEYILID